MLLYVCLALSIEMQCLYHGYISKYLGAIFMKQKCKTNEEITFETCIYIVCSHAKGERFMWRYALYYILVMRPVSLKHGLVG